MHIIACRAHFCHLLGLGQVGHSAGTLDWGPMWSGSQSTCHIQYTPDTPTLLMPLTPPNGLLHPLGASMPLMPLYPFWPWIPRVPTSTPIHPWHPLHPDAPDTLKLPPIPTPTGNPPMPLMHHIPILAPEYLESLPAPIHPWYPLDPGAPWHPQNGPYTL